MSQDPRFDTAILQIDQANAEDPNHETVGGQELPRELLYGQRMSECLAEIEPIASEALRLAVRCQHLRRWKIPRDQYPRDRAGYLNWRNALKRFHAEQAGEILSQVGYDEATIARVQSLIRKERLRIDAEAQTLEDTACLVFLKHHFADFAGDYEDEKVISIVRKTWAKMSPKGHSEAARLLSQFAPKPRILIEQALTAAEPQA